MNLAFEHESEPAPPPKGLDELARQRLPIFCVVCLLLGVTSTLIFLVNHFTALAALAETERWGRLAGYGAAMAAVTFLLLLPRRKRWDHGDVTNAATLMILVVGVALLASALLLQKVVPNTALYGIVDLVVLHLAACLIMPWTPKEATLPFAPLWLVWVLTILISVGTDIDITNRAVGAIISPFLFAPGALLAAWRTRRRYQEHEMHALAGRVKSFGGELSRARIVHDAMFPPHFTGHIAFEYEYQPIHEIGGDYVHIHVSPETGKVTLTLLDVAGHGLAAALTVNRLFGELERILAENQAAEPAEIVNLLNRYIYLTMARHSLYATGTCMMLDPTSGELQWVNAGHPPSLVRHPRGKVAELSTTTMLLGAMEPDLFTTGTKTMKLSPGDVVIAYTDGAFEARDAAGCRFGLDRIRETACFDPPPRSWPRFLAGAVAKHHDGHAEDDVLIASLTLRSLRVPDVVPQHEGVAANPRR